MGGTYGLRMPTPTFEVDRGDRGDGICIASDIMVTHSPKNGLFSGSSERYFVLFVVMVSVLTPHPIF